MIVTKTADNEVTLTLGECEISRFDEGKFDNLEDWITEISFETPFEVGPALDAKGAQVKIYAIHPNSDRPIHGSVLEDGKWAVRSWKSNGEHGSRKLNALKPPL